MLIYKILTEDQISDLRVLGEIPGAPIDARDGFIHFSTAAQVAETAAKHFAGQADLSIAAYDAEAMGDALRWEVSRGGDLFPHLYAPLRHDDIVWVEALPLGPDGHILPDAVA